MPIALNKATLIALVLECCLFGLYTNLFAATLWCLLRRSQSGPRSRVMLATVSVLMYLIAIANLALDAQNAVNAFVDWADVANGFSIYNKNHTQAIDAAKGALCALQSCFSDLIFMWRCYVVWNKRWYVVMIPSVFFLATLVGCIGATRAYMLAPQTEVMVWGAYTLTMTLANNVICTGVLGFKIWKLQRSLKGVQIINSNVVNTLSIIVESGFLIASTLLVIVVLWATENPAEGIVRNSAPTLMGIIFSMIIVRVALGVSTEEGSPQIKTSSTTTLPHHISIDVTTSVESKWDHQTESTFKGSEYNNNKKSGAGRNFIEV